jgi:hypothetical protein
MTTLASLLPFTGGLAAFPVLALGAFIGLGVGRLRQRRVTRRGRRRR